MNTLLKLCPSLTHDDNVEDDADGRQRCAVDGDGGVPWRVGRRWPVQVDGETAVPVDAGTGGRQVPAVGDVGHHVDQAGKVDLRGQRLWVG